MSQLHFQCNDAHCDYEFNCQMNNLENNEWPKAKEPVKIFCLNQDMRFSRVNLTKDCFSLTLVLRCIKLNFVFASFYNIGKREIIRSERKHHQRDNKKFITNKLSFTGYF